MKDQKVATAGSLNGLPKEPETAQDVLVTEKFVDPITNQLVQKRYIRGRFLGKGGFAKVYEMRSLDGSNKISAGKVVAKQSLQKARAKQKMMSEIKIHRSLHNENIVRFDHFFEDDENVYIMLELCCNQTLNDQVKRRKRLTEVEVQCYGIQILQALRYLHSMRIIHRDLKLGNMFLSDKMQIKIGDFGLAAKLDFEGERKRTVCGTPNYIAPEVLDNQIGHSFQVDIWSLGVILYAMLFGRPPFETADVKATYKRIRLNDYKFPDTVTVSKEAKAVISSILVLDPKLRPSVDEILDMPFFQKNSIPKLLPASSLACPPSNQFLNQYLTTPPIRPATYGTAHSLKSKINKDGPSVWIKKWVDYSTKYGIGYILSNLNVGVFFNDNTKLVQDDAKNYTYFERKGADKTDSEAKFGFDSVPASLEKKVLIHDRFAKYIIGDDQNEQLSVSGAGFSEAGIHVKKWFRTQHAMMFRLSNSVVQVCFQDQTEILLSTDTKLVTFKNRAGSRVTFTMRKAFEIETTVGNRNEEMQEFLKRLKYTKDLIQGLIEKQIPASQTLQTVASAAQINTKSEIITPGNLKTSESQKQLSDQKKALQKLSLRK